MNMKHQTKGNAWVGILLMIVLLSGLGLGLIADATMTVAQTKKAQQVVVAQALTDAGIEKAVWKINQNSNYIGENDIALATGTVDVAVSNIDANNKSVLVTAYVPSKSAPKQIRKIRATISAESNAENVSFHYGVQTGPKGITMTNNTAIFGNVYTSGAITGANHAMIYGDVISSGATGKIDNVTICTANADKTDCDTTKINRFAKAHTITGSTIYGDAYYQTISSTTVKGTSHPGSPDPASQNLPIDATTISNWETTAAAGGTINGYSLLNGASASLGPKKINGNFTIDNNAILTLTGAIWVTGNVTISNSSVIRLDPNVFGTNGSMIIADNPSDPANYGAITIGNGVHICGAVAVSDCQNNTIPAGNKSYLMLLSTNTGNVAINVGNGGNAVVYYATVGSITISNGSHVRALTGGGLSLINNSSIDYDTGLASTEFSDGPGGSWMLKQWQICKSDTSGQCNL